MCMFVHHMSTRCLQWAEEVIGSPGTGVTSHFSKTVLLTIEPSLQQQHHALYEVSVCHSSPSNYCENRMDRLGGSVVSVAAHPEDASFVPIPDSSKSP